MNNPIFSIIIPVSRTISLDLLLTSLGRQIFDKNEFEILLVCDKKENLRPRDDDLKIHLSISDNPHPSAKRNKGASLASGEYFIFLDDDTEVPPHWLDLAHTKIKNRRDTIINGPDYNDSNLMKILIADILKNHPFAEGTGNRLPTKELEVNFLSISLCNTIMHREIFFRIGGFNENIHFTLDDTEFFYLAQKSGMKIIKSPELKIFHQRPPMIFPYFKHRATRRFRVGVNTILFPQIFTPTRAFKLMVSSWIVFPLYIYSLFYFPLQILTASIIAHGVFTILSTLRFIREKLILLLLLPPAFLGIQIISWLGYTIGFIWGLIQIKNLKQLRAAQIPRWSKVKV